MFSPPHRPTPTSARSETARTLRLEPLEARLNLSGLSGLAAPESIFYVPEFAPPSSPSTPTSGALVNSAVREVGSLSSSGRGVRVESLSFGASTLNVGVGTTAIPVDQFTAIANCRPEQQWGQTTPNIGFVSTNGAFVEYSVNAANGGMYRLNFGLASIFGADLRVEVNGTFNGQVVAAPTGAWNRFSPNTALIQLPSGSSTIRFTTQNWTQYNLNNITLALAAAPAAVTAIGDNATVPVTAYSAIHNSQLEYKSGTPNIGYVSTMGAYVDYSVNVASAGNYTLTTAAGSWNSAGYDVFTNGTRLASFSTPASYDWRSSTSQSRTVYLPAGAQTLRFVATGGTQYNLFSIGLARQVTTPTPPAGTVIEPSPPPTPAPAPSPLPEVTISERWMTSFTELNIVGTPGNDTIFISQSGGTLNIAANGALRQITGNIGDIAVWGGAGDDKIQVDGTVSVDARLYGGDGKDSLVNFTRGNATIVSLGDGVDSLGGNYLNTNYWVDKQDLVYAGSLEWNSGRVHIIENFYQPYGGTTVGLALNGPNLIDPTAKTDSSTRLSSSSFWGVSPQLEDINQGSVGDCYFLTALQSLAQFQPDRLRTLAVDLGDGTYAVQFKRGGTTQHVRVDGDLATWGAGGGLVYNRPGASGAQWASIFEKAYAHFRTGANSYASIDFGWMVAVYSDFGVASTGYALPLDQNSFYNTALAALSANRPVDVGTMASLTPGAPFIARHTYSVLNVAKDGNGTVQVTLRNPWGSDGASYDDNSFDGLLTLPYSLLKANCASGSILV